MLTAIIKIALVVFLLNNYWEARGEEFQFCPMSSDNASYIEPFTHLFENGCYCFLGEPYAGRMPSVGMIYYLGLFILSKENALSLVLIFQILIDILATTLLFDLAYKIFKRQSIALLAFSFYLLFPYSTVFSLRVNTESLACSFLVFSFYFLVKSQKKHLFLSGLFMVFSIFLRPFLIALLIPLIVYFFLNRTGLKKIIFYSIPITLVFSSWMIRNYLVFEKPYFLQSDRHAGYTYDPIFYPLASFIKAWGGDLHPNNPNGEGRWFYQFEEEGPWPWQDQFEHPGYLPNFIYTSYYNKDSLIHLKSMIKQYYLTKNEIKKQSIEKSIIVKVKLYTTSFKKEKPIFHLIYAPLRLLKNFLIHSGSYNLTFQPFEKLSFINKFIKIIWELFYFTVLVGFFISLLFVMKHIITLNYFVLLIYCAAFLSIALFPIYERHIEYRYLVTSWPFMVILASYSISRIGSSLSVFLFDKQLIEK